MGPCISGTQPFFSSQLQNKLTTLQQFIGTSLALAIPLFMVRRQRGAALRVSLKNSAPPPPRRSSSTAANFDPKSITGGSASPSTTEVVESFSSEGASPGISEMMSALSRMNASSALMAAKAFGIATALVAVGGMGLMWGVKTTLGVNDVGALFFQMYFGSLNHFF